MISLNTIALKEALSKVNKCAKKDKTAPLTQLLNIKTSNTNCITFTTTDERNIFSYTLKDETQQFENIDVCVLVEQISKLVSKFTSAKTDLYISETGNELKLRGDGTYTISIPIDAQGQPIKYPDYVAGEPITDCYTGSISSILNAAKYCEGSITKLTYDIQVEDYPRTNYFIGSKVIALDGFLATMVEGDFLPFNTLVSPVTLKLLANFTDDSFKAYKTKNYNVFECSNCRLLTVEPEGLDAYPLEVAEQTINHISGNAVDISAGVLVSALNRLSLFTDQKIDNCIKLKFNSNGVFAYTVNESCVEQICAEPQNDEFECYINASSFLSLLKAYGADVITLYYGDEQALKIEFNEVSQIIVLSELGDN